MSKELTIKDAAKFMQVTVQALYVALKLRKIHGYKKDGKWYFSMDEIHGYMGRKYNRKYSIKSDGEPSFDRKRGELCTREVSERLNIPMQRAYYLMRTGLLKTRKKGGCYVVFVRDLDEAKKILNNNLNPAAQVESYGDSTKDNRKPGSLGST